MKTKTTFPFAQSERSHLYCDYDSSQLLLLLASDDGSPGCVLLQEEVGTQQEVRGRVQAAQQHPQAEVAATPAPHIADPVLRVTTVTVALLQLNTVWAIILSLVIHTSNRCLVDISSPL